MQLVMAEPAFDPVLAPKHHGVAGAAPAHQVLGEIDLRVREKGGAGHGRAIDQGGAGARAPMTPQKSQIAVQKSARLAIDQSYSAS